MGIKIPRFYGNSSWQLTVHFILDDFIRARESLPLCQRIVKIVYKVRIPCNRSYETKLVVLKV